MRIIFTFVFLTLHLACHSQKEDCRLAEVIAETISLYDKRFHAGRGFPEDERDFLNFRVYSIKSNDFSSMTIDENMEYQFEIDDGFFGHPLSLEPISFIVAVTNKNYFEEKVIPNCIFDIGTSKVLFYDFEQPILVEKMKKKKRKELVTHFSKYSNAYVTWIVNVDRSNVTIGEVIGNYSPYDP